MSPSRSRSDAGPSQPSVNAADLGQVVGHPPLGDVGERATGADRGQLAGVADQQQLRPRLPAAAVDRDQIGRGGGAGLVDHQQIPAAQPERLVVAGASAGVEAGLPVEPPADVPRGHAFLGEHIGLPLPVGDPEHPRPARTAVWRGGVRAGWVGDPVGGVGPGVGQGADEERLAGAGGGVEDLDRGTGGEDAAQRRLLILPERAPALGEPVHHRVDGVSDPGGGAAAGRSGADLGLAEQLGVGGEPGGVRLDEHALPVRPVILAVQALRPAARVEVPGQRLRLVGQPVQERLDLGGRDTEMPREGVGHGQHQVRPGPGLARVLHRGQRPGHDVPLGPPLRLDGSTAEDGGGQGGDVAAERGVVLVGPAGELPVAGLPPEHLALAGDQRGLIGQGRALPPGRCSPLLGLEPGHQRREGRRDRGGPLGEQPRLLDVHPGDLAGLAVGAGLPPRPVALPAVRLGDPRPDHGGGVVPLGEQREVQRPHRPVGALDLVGDRAVHVQLRVVVPRVVLQELRRDQVMPVDPLPATAAVMPGPGVAGLRREEVQHRPMPHHQRLLHPRRPPPPLRRHDLVAGGRGVGRGALTGHPQQGHRLRRRQHHVVERDRLPRRPRRLRPQLRALLRPGLRVLVEQPGVDLVGLLIVPRRVPEPRRRPPRLPRRRVRVPWIQAVGVERLHHLRVDLTDQPQRGRAPAVPQPGRLAGRHGAGVVTLPALRHRVGQVVGVVPDPQVQHDLEASLNMILCVVVPSARQGRRHPPWDRDAMVWFCCWVLE